MSFLRKYIFGQESIRAEEAAAAALKSAASSGNIRINERQVQSAPPTIPPRKSIKNDFVRARSLTKVFNQLPLVLPDLTEIQLDIVEWYCHVCLLESNPVRLQHFRQELIIALGHHQPRRYGRLYNRLHLTALWNDVCCGTTISTTTVAAPASTVAAFSPGDDQDQDAAMEAFSINVTAAQWRQIKEQFVLLKSYLLRQDANLAVPSISSDTLSPTAPPPQHAAPDGNLEKHDMFRHEYQLVVLLLQVQQALASFCSALENCKGKRNLVKHSEEAIDAYENTLATIFAKEDDQHASVGIVPKELTAFLLRDLYQKGNRAAPHPNILVATWLQHATDIVTNVTSEFSHFNLKQKVCTNLISRLLACLCCVLRRKLFVLSIYILARCTVGAARLSSLVSHTLASLFFYRLQVRSLLIKWSESILDIPVLVQQEYGGVTNPVMEHEADDVSSFGDEGHDDQPLMTQAMQNVDDAVDSALAAVTAEERVMIETMNEVSPAVHPQQRTVEKMPRSACRTNSVTAAAKNNGDMELEPLMTQAPPLSPDDGSTAGDDTTRDQEPTKVPTKEELLQATDKLFKEVTDIDTVTTEQFFTTMGQRYSFKLGPPQKDVITSRLTDLVSDIGTAAAPGSGESEEQADVPSKIPTNSELFHATNELFKEVTDQGRETVHDFFKAMRARYNFKLGKVEKKIVMHRLEELTAVKNKVELEDHVNANNMENPSKFITDDETVSEEESAKKSSAKKEPPAKKELRRLHWSDSESEVEDFGGWGSAAKKAKISRKPNAVVRRHSMENRKTGPFTDDEIAAIREGVATHGVGKWQHIIDNCDGRLQNRTGVQVKDKFRNMKRSGQI